MRRRARTDLCGAIREDRPYRDRDRKRTLIVLKLDLGFHFDRLSQYQIWQEDPFPHSVFGSFVSIGWSSNSMSTGHMTIFPDYNLNLNLKVFSPKSRWPFRKRLLYSFEDNSPLLRYAQGFSPRRRRSDRGGSSGGYCSCSS